VSTDIDLDHAPVAPNDPIEGKVPVIDLSADHAGVIAQIDSACRDWGFFQIVGHGVPTVEISRLLDVTRAYFAQPRETKRQQLRTRENPWGYYDRELTKERRDRKEVFDIGPDASGAGSSVDVFAGHTPWPAQPPELRGTIEAWIAQMNRISAGLVSAIAEALTGDAARLQPSFEPSDTSFLRLNYYPLADPMSGERPDEADLGIHHHTDAGALTVLLQDGVSGLQVYRDGYWHNVQPVPGAFTINIGDMTQVWSNDLYRAPVHRVLAMDRSERVSVPYFYNPAYEALVAPLAGEPVYQPIKWGEFRRRRAEGDFAAYGTEVQISQYRRAA